MGTPQGFRLLYQTEQFDAGRPGTSVLSSLAHPPATAVAAETWSDEQARAKGLLTDTPTAMQKLAYTNRDYYRDLADHQSIIHPEGDHTAGSDLPAT